MRVWIGETVRVRVDFTDDAGVPMAAAGVSIISKDPSGQRMTGTVVPTNAAGAYYADFQMTLAGTWYFRAECSGPTPAATEDSVEVLASNV